MILNSAKKCLEFKIEDKVIIDLLKDYFDSVCINKREDVCFVEFHCIPVGIMRGKNMVLDLLIENVYAAAEKEGLTSEPSFHVSFYL